MHGTASVSANDSNETRETLKVFEVHFVSVQ